MAIDLQTETLLTVSQAAEMLHRHPDTVKKWIKRGVLEGIKLGGHWQTSVEAIARATTWSDQALAPPTPHEVRRAHNEAEERLRKRGLLRPGRSKK